MALPVDRALTAWVFKRPFTSTGREARVLCGKAKALALRNLKGRVSTAMEMKRPGNILQRGIYYNI